MTGAHTAFLPRHALVNDLWTGFVPEELQGLTRVEVSMIAQVNPLLNITVLPTSGSSCLKAFQYSVVTLDECGKGMGTTYTSLDLS